MRQTHLSQSVTDHKRMPRMQTTMQALANPNSRRFCPWLQPAIDKALRLLHTYTCSMHHAPSSIMGPHSHWLQPKETLSATYRMRLDC
jgi:hypothetical protein